MIALILNMSQRALNHYIIILIKIMHENNPKGFAYNNTAYSLSGYYNNNNS